MSLTIHYIQVLAFPLKMLNLLTDQQQIESQPDEKHFLLLSSRKKSVIEKSIPELEQPVTSLKLFGPSITTSPLPRFFYFTSEFECFELSFLCVSVHNLWPSELTVSARAFTKAFTIVRTGAGWHEHVYPNELRRQVLTTTFNCVWSATDQSKELVPREGQQGQGHALLKTLLRAWVSMAFMGKGVSSVGGYRA